MNNALLSQTPQAVCDDLKSYMPELRECRPHAGKFDLTELKRAGLPSQSIVISVLGAKQDATYAGHASSFMLQMAAYVIAKDELGEPRDVRAANMCQLILSRVPGQNWGLSGLGQARDVKMLTLVSSKTRDHAVSLWAVTWSQPITFFAPEKRPLGVELYAAHKPAGTDLAEADYIEFGGGTNVD